MLWHLANVLDDIGQISVLAIEAVLGLMSKVPTPNPPPRPYKKKVSAAAVWLSNLLPQQRQNLDTNPSPEAHGDSIKTLRIRWAPRERRETP